MTDVAGRTALVRLYQSGGRWVDVGYLKNSNEITRFEFIPEYWEQAPRPVLGQIFEERGRDWKPSQRVALPTWFSHLLPEGYMRSVVSAAVDAKPQREFPMLVRIGKDDLPGAVRVILSEHGDEAEPDIEERHAHRDEYGPENPVLKFSLAGVQPKFSVLNDPVRGLTLPAKGQAGDYIVKLPDGRPAFAGVPQAELAALTLAGAVGISVPKAFLVDVAAVGGLPSWARIHPGKALAIERFDRAPNEDLIHAEVLAQVLDVPTANERLKYTRANFETVASICNALCGPDAAYDVIDRIVLNVLVGNGDAHLKNWAITYPDGFTPQLSPAFDIVPTVLFIPDDDLGMKLNSSRSFYDVTQSSFERLASRIGLEPTLACRRVDETVNAIEANWSILADMLDAVQYAQLTKRRDGLPLFRLRTR